MPALVRRSANHILDALSRSDNPQTVNSKDATHASRFTISVTLAHDLTKRGTMNTFRRIDRLLDGKTSDELAKEVAARHEQTEQNHRSNGRKADAPAEEPPTELDVYTRPQRRLRTKAPRDE